MKNRDALVGLVDYQAGNLQSIANAFEHLDASVVRVGRGSNFEGLTHLVLPGVGAFGFCMERLQLSGLIPVIEEWALGEGRPLLGICVGMQLMADRGEEGEGYLGLSWGGGVVKRMLPGDPKLRVPHVGWNSVEFSETFGEFHKGSVADFYFDHSFALDGATRARGIGVCRHGQEFQAVVRRGNMVGAQFHPEKSQSAGLRFLNSFLELGNPYA